MPLAGMAHPAVFLCDHEIPIVSPRPPPVISDMHLFNGGYIAAEAVAGKPAAGVGDIGLLIGTRAILRLILVWVKLG